MSGSMRGNMRGTDGSARRSRRVPAPLPRRVLQALAALLLVGCASSAVERTAELLRQGRAEAALALADGELASNAHDPALRVLQERARSLALQQQLLALDRSRAAGRYDEARSALARVRALDPSFARLPALQQEIDRHERHARLLAEAQAAMATGREAAARELLSRVLAASPQDPAALALLQRLTPEETAEALPSALSEVFRQKVSLQFREAPLRSVFDALGRDRGLNFIFDREVRGDLRVSLSLRDVRLDEALRLLLQTQQLRHKLLNENTLLIYPDTPAKQRQHQELVTRTLYLANADPKTVQSALRTIGKLQDVHVDDRLAAVVVRDTPSAVRMAEQLAANLDLPEAEVLLEVEVLEVASSRVQSLGLQWPERVDFGVVRPDGTVPERIVIGRDLQLRGSVLNPALAASLRGTSGTTQTLANPTIRARNREKAQVHVGEKLPVFASTPATATVPGSTSVTYLDVGIKLEVQPVVQLDNEVTIKVDLEVSNLVRQVSGPAGSVGYEIGTRRTSTALRLRDGETQVLAGLVKDEDRRNAAGLPGLVTLPVAGRLFGVHEDNRVKTEVVLLITPHVLRNIPVPPAWATRRDSGTALEPGATPLRLASGSSASAPLARGQDAAAPAGPATAEAAPVAPAPAATPAAAAVAAGGQLRLSTTGRVVPGGTVSVTLANTSRYRVRGELAFDAQLLANAAAGAEQGASLPFDLAPGADAVFVLRLQSGAAAGQITQVQIVGLSASGAEGAAVAVESTGDGSIEVADGP